MALFLRADPAMALIVLLTGRHLQRRLLAEKQGYNDMICKESKAFH